MSDDIARIKAASAALEKSTALNLHQYPIQIDVRNGTAILSGEVSDISAKRLAPLIVAATADISSVLDRLKIATGDHRGDKGILDDVAKALLDEPVFKNYSIRVTAEEEPLRRPDSRDSIKRDIEINVTDRQVALTGKVESLSHKRLADVLAWWIPGVADVDNKLRVAPPEMDNDGEVSDAVRMVLKKDPVIDADQIAVNTLDRTVTLDGYVHSSETRHQAELDAWYVLGVHNVINHIEIST